MGRLLIAGGRFLFFFFKLSQRSMHRHHTQMEGGYMMVKCLVGTENLSDVRGRGCPCLPSEERLPRAGGK